MGDPAARHVGRGIRTRLEAGFERYGHAVARRRWLVLAAVGVATAALAAQIPRLTFDTSNDAMLHPDDPQRVAYDEFRAQFGRDDVIVIAVETPQLLSMDALERLRAFHRDLETNVPHVDEVTSLWNARATRAEGDVLIVGELMERWPETPEDLASLRERVLANPLYRKTVVSADTRIGAVTVQLDAYSPLPLEEVMAGFDDDGGGAVPRLLTGDEHDALVRAVHAVIARHDAPDFRLRAAGQPIMISALLEVMQVDLLRSLALAVAAIAVLLFAIFRRPAAVALPLLVVGLAVAGTLGLLALFGAAISFGTQVIPSFLLAVGVGYAVHVLAIFFQRYDRGTRREQAIAEALGHSGLPILLTALTTAGGLLSFAVADLFPVATLGVFAPAGVALSFAYSVTLLPALLASVPVGRRAPAPGRGRTAERYLVAAGDFAVRHPRRVLVVSALVVGVAAAGTARIRLSHDLLEWFPRGSPLRDAIAFVDRELSGAMPLEVLIEAGRENALHDPELLRGVEAMARHAEGARHDSVLVGKAWSIADAVKEVNRALHEDRAEFYAIPDDRDLVAQELLLFEQSGTDDLEELTDHPTLARARLTLMAGWTDALHYPPFLESLRGPFEALAGDRARVRFVGVVPMMSRVMDAVLQSMIKSYALALAIITPLMVLLIGSLRIGLASMAPNLAPIAVTLGLMGWLGIPLDAFTLLVGGIAIGLAVDDTIHFMHNASRYLAATGDPLEAVRRTLSTAGRALLFTSAVLISGFLIFAASPMWNLKYFGMLTAFAIAAAFVADLVVSPALVTLLARSERSGG